MWNRFNENQVYRYLNHSAPVEVCIDLFIRTTTTKLGNQESFIEILMTNIEDRNAQLKKFLEYHLI